VARRRVKFSVIRGAAWFAVNLAIAFGVIAFMAGWRFYLMPADAGQIILPLE
jgi:hypothetical protein